MDFHAGTRGIIDFYFRPANAHALNNAALTVLLSRRYRGGLDVIGITKRGDGNYYGLIRLKFADHSNWDDARAHCHQVIENGQVAEHYVGALDRADPGLPEARRILGLLQAELSELDSTGD